jgi:DNA replication licensing factor MCM7
MEEGDRTAIHEVMEQQTVSIAKAGITTTLNARAAVLAAANPVWGRWRPKASPEQNLGLPASLLSRFDLTWIILDKPDAELDMALARHVTHVHIHSEHPEAEGGGAGGGLKPFEPAFLRNYIARARTFRPWVPRELTEYIVQSYVTLRKDGDDSGDTMQYGQQHYNANTRQRFCTARMLLSILRLSQALARLHFRDQVERDDVEEAMRLLNSSRESHLDDSERAASARSDPVSAIFQLVSSMAQESGRTTVSLLEAHDRSIRKGYSEEQWKNTLEQYAELSVWIVSAAQIKFVSAEFLGR